MTTDNGKARVCFINMPVSAIHRPSLGLGLLAAVLKQEGISTKVLYPHLWFAEYFGYSFYAALLKTPTDDALVDWFFSSTAFHGFEGDFDKLLLKSFSRTPKLTPEEQDVLKQELISKKEKVPEFIDWVAREVLKYSPDIVGCTSVFQQHVASLAVLKRIRELEPAVVTMMGGANCETIMGKTTHESFPWVDYVVSGEAEGLIVGLCRTILEYGRDTDPAKLPTGVFSPAHRMLGYPSSSKSYDGFPRASSLSFADFPPPDYDDYFEELQSNLLGSRIIPGILFEASRGCWWGEKQHCTFCGLNGDGMGYRSKSSAQVIREIVHLSNRYHSTRLEAVDNILALDHFNTLLPRLAEMDEKYDIFFETKANLKREQVALLAGAGIRWIQPGIESLHSSVLKLIHKGVSAWQNIQTLKFCRQEGIYVAWTVLSCFPGEQDDWYAEMARIIPLLHHLQPGGCNALRYDRYSPYHANSEISGLSLVPNPSYQEVYPLPPEKIADLVYFFEEEGVGDYARQLFDTPIRGRPGLQATRDAIKTWRHAWPEAALVGRDDKGTLFIEDSRACAVSKQHELTGLAKQVLEACDDAPTLHRLQTMLPEKTGLDAIISDLIAKKLLVEIDSRLLSLVLKSPVPETPPAYKPFGRVLPAGQSNGLNIW